MVGLASGNPAAALMMYILVQATWSIQSLRMVSCSTVAGESAVGAAAGRGPGAADTTAAAP